MRQIVLDTETTGLEPSQGHRIIEIGCVEMIGRKLTGHNFHQYICPEREVEAGALEVHGISNEFLADQPKFLEVVDHFIEYIRGAELVIHNAAFDVGFLNHEFALATESGKPSGTVEDICTVLDTLQLARNKHPGQKNSLDALCKRYDVDNSSRDLHGALLDAKILAEVYLRMTGGQTSLSLGAGNDASSGQGNNSGSFQVRKLATPVDGLRVIQPSAEEAQRHADELEMLEEASGGNCLWNKLDRA